MIYNKYEISCIVMVSHVAALLIWSFVELNYYYRTHLVDRGMLEPSSWFQEKAL